MYVENAARRLEEVSNKPSVSNGIQSTESKSKYLNSTQLFELNKIPVNQPTTPPLRNSQPYLPPKQNGCADPTTHLHTLDCMHTITPINPPHHPYLPKTKTPLLPQLFLAPLHSKTTALSHPSQAPKPASAPLHMPVCIVDQIRCQYERFLEEQKQKYGRLKWEMRDNVVGLEKDGTHEQEGEGQEDASGNAVVKAKVEEDKGKIEDVEMEDMVDRLIYAKVGVDENDSVVDMLMEDACNLQLTTPGQGTEY
ncbi:hypothetical protein HRS9122_02863 [Pyrenophora teres f. teres]|nr:hypothetical protein HRS9122_02863 [Pyrenophora teres f. teres]